jgi:hypothetical protein
LGLNGVPQLLIYADDNLLRKNINIIMDDTEASLDASKEVGLEVKAM